MHKRIEALNLEISELRSTDNDIADALSKTLNNGINVIFETKEQVDDFVMQDDPLDHFEFSGNIDVVRDIQLDIKTLLHDLMS